MTRLPSCHTFSSTTRATVDRLQLDSCNYRMSLKTELRDGLTTDCRPRRPTDGRTVPGDRPANDRRGRPVSAYRRRPGPRGGTRGGNTSSTERSRDPGIFFSPCVAHLRPFVPPSVRHARRPVSRHCPALLIAPVGPVPSVSPRHRRHRLAAGRQDSCVVATMAMTTTTMGRGARAIKHATRKGRERLERRRPRPPRRRAASS